MKKIIMLLLPFLLFTSCPGSTDDNPGPSGPDGPAGPDGLGGLKDPITHNMSAAEYIAAKGLNAGWNMGNTYDGGSSNPRYAAGHYDKLFQGIKAAGFNVIRIPITWGSRFNTTTNTIDPVFLDELESVVSAAHAAGLVTFFNSHHDVRNTGLFSLYNSGVSYAADGESGADYVLYLNRFKALWQQAAQRFRDYCDWLLFEPLNEPTISVGGVTYWDNASAEYYQVINKWNQAFIDTVRASGGNNEKRYLLFSSYAAKLTPATSASYVIPTDPAGQGKLIYTFHAYVPQQLALEGGDYSWSSYSSSNFTVPFEQANEKFMAKGIPVILGETGATFHSQRSGTDSKTANRNRLLLLNTLGHEARKAGIIPVLWDNGEAARNSSSQPNGETFAIFRRKEAHDNDTNNWGKPIDHTRINGGSSKASTGGPAMAAGNAAADDPDFGRVSIEAFIDAVNNRSTQWKNQAGMPASLSGYFVD